MSNTDRDDGDDNAPPSPETTADDPIAVLLDQEDTLDQIEEDTPGRSMPGSDGGPSSQPPAASDQNLDDGGTEDTRTTEQPQEGEGQWATPVRRRPVGPSDGQQSPASDLSVDRTPSRPSDSNPFVDRTPSPSRAAPQTPSRNNGMMSRFLNRWIVATPTPRPRRTNTAGSGDIPSIAPTSNPTAPSGSRPGSLTSVTTAPSTGSPTPELVGPSRRRLNSQSSSSQGSAGSPGRGDAGPRPTRANTGLSIDADAGDLEAIGENTPTPIGTRSRRFPITPRGASDGSGSLPTTPTDPEWELRRRNRALLGIFDIIRTRGLATDGTGWEQGRDRLRDWTFQLGNNTLDAMTDEGVASMTGVLAGANVPDEIRPQILREVERRGRATRDRVNTALADERVFLDNTANSIVGIIESANIRARGRGASSAASVASQSSQSSQPEPAPMERRALMRNTREQLIDTILALDQRRNEAEERIAELEDAAAHTKEATDAERVRLQANANAAQTEYRRETQDLRNESQYWQDLAEAARPAAPPTQDPAIQPPSRSESQGSRETTRSRSETGSAPRSPAREQAFDDLRTVFGNIAQHERLVRRLQESAGLDPGPSDADTSPWSPNAQIPRTRLLLELRTVTGERDEARQNEDRLQARVDALEAARLSPPSPRGSGLLGNLFGGNRERQSSSGDSRSRSGSRANSDAPPRNLADELEAQSSGESDNASRRSDASRTPSNASNRQPDASRRPSNASRRQSDASRRQSDASRRQSDASRRPSNASSRQSNASSRQSGRPDVENPAPLRVIPEWLAAHPDGPCEDCVPVLRFPPELGELPTCGCICDLALGIPPPSAAGSSGSGSSKSRASSRSVRFADDGAVRDENNGRRRPAPLNLTSLSIPEEEDDTNRPGTPHPAIVDGSQPAAPASDAQPEVAVLAAPGGRRGQNCPCCGRGVFGPPAAGGPQVAFFTCRNMAGQRAPLGAPPRAEGPMTLAEGLRTALAAAAAAAAGLVGTGGANRGNAGPPAPPEAVAPADGDRDNAEPPAGPGPVAPGPVAPEPVAPGGRDRRNTDPPAPPGRAPPPILEERNRRNTDPPRIVAPGAPLGDNGDFQGPRQAAWDPVMAALTLLWDLIIFLPMLLFRGLGLIIWWIYNAICYGAEMGLYLNLRYLARLNVIRPAAMAIPFPSRDVQMIALWFLIVWFVTMLIALYEERRIWRAANAQDTAAYFRGLAARRPYPWWSIYQVDYGLLQPVFGRVSEWLHAWYFGE
ncbi:hypothetical protein Daus18300_006907 [Diaporthe australafricana]|uniref:Uncharacterized protein n=1 Tax=Diaporthe australafricana TaxID=127596 RepID=A0ABR3WRG8_9PEZI